MREDDSRSLWTPYGPTVYYQGEVYYQGDWVKFDRYEFRSDEALIYAATLKLAAQISRELAGFKPYP